MSNYDLGVMGGFALVILVLALLEIKNVAAEVRKALAEVRAALNDKDSE